jgi:hypothetical protein
VHGEAPGANEATKQTYGLNAQSAVKNQCSKKASAQPTYDSYNTTVNTPHGTTLPIALITLVLTTACTPQSNQMHCPQGHDGPCPTSADVWDARAERTVTANNVSNPLSYSVAHAKQSLRYNLTQAAPTSQYTIQHTANLTNTTLIINASTAKQPLEGTTAIRLTNPQASGATTLTTLNGDKPSRIAIYKNNTWLNTTLEWTNTTQTTKNT